VLAPDGRMWRVGREWLPTSRLRARLRRDREMPDFSEPGWAFEFLGADLTVGSIIAAVALTILAVLVLFLAWPVVALAVEVVIVIVLFLGGLVGRLVLRRPWRIIARTKGSPRTAAAWHVVGWRASGEAIGQIADALAAGEPLPRATDRVLLHPDYGEAA